MKHKKTVYSNNTDRDTSSVQSGCLKQAPLTRSKRRDPAQIYFERSAKLAKEQGNPSAVEYLKPDLRPRHLSQIVTCQPNDPSSRKFFDDNIYDFTVGCDHSPDHYQLSQDWLKRESILPQGFKLSKNLPLRSVQGWKPVTGYPALILEKAKRFSRSGSIQKGAALLDMFLFTYLIGRIPRDAHRDLMGWDTWKKLVQQKLEHGEWELVAEGIRYYDEETGRESGKAAVYAITPGYLIKCMKSDLAKGRYNSIAALGSRKRVYPSKRKLEYSQYIPEDVRQSLRIGTGLRANSNILLHMILEPGSFKSDNYSAIEVWEKAQHGWKTLSAYLHEPLITSWNMGKNGWLYTRKPALQQLSKMVRMIGLEGSNGEGVGEIDFSGCQLNIAKAINGKAPLEDPYWEIQWEASNHGLYLKRSAVKRHTLAAFGGRTVNNYKYYHRGGKESDPVSHFSAVLKALEILEFPINDSKVRHKQGQIMIEVMRRMAEETGHTGLSIFDALLVPSSQLEVARRVMAEVSERILGVQLPFKATLAYR